MLILLFRKSACSSMASVLSRTGDYAGKSETIAWEAADHLKTDEDIANYLEAVFQDGDPALVAAALGDVARAKGMTQIPQTAGLGRESLYKALSPTGNPEFATALTCCGRWGSS